ncbi:glycosyltransferase [Curtobacterium sp. MCLR17_007]|uniref:glycosyltransferase n=1 Tax=Curtobacterium sp. MCLR17_007 TaxID=2175648 RepID=UPI0015E8DCA1|nr:glycosyltransferase [Curtobacterium sp. MCLR17_007]WIB59108.1 glycosyltransferase [Curtobacterium sp. MCLR17_007]
MPAPDRRPRVLVLASTFPARADDGVPAFVLDLARHEAQEFDTAVLTPRVPDAARSEVVDGVRVVRFPYFPRRFEDLADGAILDNLAERRSRIVQVPALMAAQYAAVRRAVRSFRPDVIHAHWAIPQALVATLAAPGVPRVVTTHGGDVYALRAAPLVRLKRWVLGRAAHVTTVNGEMRERLTSWGVPETRSSVVPMGVDLEPAAAARARTVRQPGRVVAVGRLVEKKGFGTLLEALRGIDDVPWELVVVGDGPYRTRLQDQAAGLPVTFTGQRGKTEVLDTLASAEVVALPSVPAANGDQEGLPVTLLEAAAVGAAVVASDLPGIRDVVEHDVSGLLVPPGDVASLRAALRRALTDDEARARWQQGATAAAAAFSGERIGERYRAVLRDALR